MTSFGRLGISLSVVFACLLLAIVAELFYLLFWKNKVIIRPHREGGCSNHAKEMVHLFFGQKKASSCTKCETGQDKARVGPENGDSHEVDLERGSGKDMMIKTFGEESMEAELMRLHNLAGPPRFLFTIKEETKEDLESDYGNSKKGSRMTSFSELLDTPFLSPLASPPKKYPSSLNPLDSYSHHGFNPLFDSSAEVDHVYRLRSSSPPPKFKFLRDAEEKLYKRLIQQAEVKRASKPLDSYQESEGKSPREKVLTEEQDESMFTFFVSNNKDAEIYHHLPQYPTISSQVLPLAAPPQHVCRPLDKKFSLH